MAYMVDIFKAGNIPDMYRSVWKWEDKFSTLMNTQSASTFPDRVA